MSIEAQSELRRWADMWGKWVGPEGDRERYKRMAQYAIDGAEAIAFRDADAREVEEHSAYADKVAAERDTLRAELAAALEACGDNAKAWQDCVEESAIKRTHLMAEIGLTEQQRNAASARAEKAEAEATALKAHVERLRGGNQRDTAWVSTGCLVCGRGGIN